MRTTNIDIILAKKSRLLSERARQLGFQEVIFALPYHENLNLRAVDAIIIKNDSPGDLRRQINIAVKNNKKPIILPQGRTLRAAFENKLAWLIVMPDLNHVLCNLARKNNILVGIDFSAIRKADIRQRARIFEKMLKISRLCRKYKTKIIIATFAEKTEDMVSKQDLQAFADSLGMLTS